MNLKQQIQEDFKASVKAKFLLIIGLCLVLGACGNNVQSPVDASFDSVAEALSNGGCVNLSRLQWTRDPKSFEVNDGIITITTAPHTDLWQRTYYHFRNDNAPVLQMKTREQYFSFLVKTDFTQSHQRFDQCGIVMYLDSDNRQRLPQGYAAEYPGPGRSMAAVCALLLR